MGFLSSLFGGKPSSRSDEDDDEHDMVSYVVLSTTHSPLTLSTLRERLDRVYPGWFVPPRERGTFVVDGAVEGATYLINSSIPGASGTYMLHNVSGPYTAFSNFAEFIDDAAMRVRAEAHESWLSVDLIASGHVAEAEAYGLIGRVLAELAPPDAGFLVHPTKGVTLPFDDVLRRRLANCELVFGSD